MFYIQLTEFNSNLKGNFYMLSKISRKIFGSSNERSIKNKFNCRQY